jgi:hypothetical protein
MRAGVRLVVVAALVVGAGCYSDASPELPESPPSESARS